LGDWKKVPELTAYTKGYLMEYETEKRTDPCINFLVSESVRNGRMNAIQMLKEAGVDISAKDDARWGPIHYAASNGLEDVITMSTQSKC
jgi:hypothetical protein